MANAYSKSDSTRHSPREPKEKKAVKPIPKESEKIKGAKVRYKKARAKYLLAFPYCEVVTCNSLADQIHHKKGRIGSLLTDSDFFLAVCAECHKKIEENVTWAKENGYSLDRL